MANKPPFGRMYPKRPPFTPQRHGRPPSDPTPGTMAERAAMSSLTWPKHWRKCIYRITRLQDIHTGALYFNVVPRNPEYDTYLEKENLNLNEIPSPTLPAVDFDSLEEVETWARVVCRLDG